MEDKIQFYRAPMVTATGILLGFVLNFASNWVTKAFSTDNLREVIIGAGLCACITLLLIVLYRILNMEYPKDKAEAYYKKTLLLFLTGISITFLAVVIVMVESYIKHNR
jgi:hypothetical protein